MPLFSHLPKREGVLMKVPPRPGMRGVVHYCYNTGPAIPPEGTAVEVVGPAGEPPNQWMHVNVFALNSGKEFTLGHWHVDCGEVLFVDGQWRALDDPAALAWFERTGAKRPEEELRQAVAPPAKKK